MNYYKGISLDQPKVSTGYVVWVLCYNKRVYKMALERSVAAGKLFSVLL